MRPDHEQYDRRQPSPACQTALDHAVDEAIRDAAENRWMAEEMMAGRTTKLPPMDPLGCTSKADLIRRTIADVDALAPASLRVRRLPQVAAPRAARARGAGRPRAQASRSSAASGDSGSDEGPGERAAVLAAGPAGRAA